MNAVWTNRETMDANYQTMGCETEERWYAAAVNLQGPRGIAARMKEARRKGRLMAEKLKPGEFIAVENLHTQICLGGT